MVNPQAGHGRGAAHHRRPVRPAGRSRRRLLPADRHDRPTGRCDGLLGLRDPAHLAHPRHADLADRPRPPDAGRRHLAGDGVGRDRRRRSLRADRHLAASARSDRATHPAAHHRSRGVDWQRPGSRGHRVQPRRPVQPSQTDAGGAADLAAVGGGSPVPRSVWSPSARAWSGSPSAWRPATSSAGGATPNTSSCRASQGYQAADTSRA